MQDANDRSNGEAAAADRSAGDVVTHSSLDKFNIAEAIADSIFGHLNKEKACQFEPDKPCDHCSMCSSRGF